MMTTQDMRDVSNIHEASLGQKSNEVSGKAIQARQQMTDLSSFIYHDRLRIAEERCARLCNELIPTVYDTTRIAVVFGEDDKAMQMVLNDPTDPNTDVTLGKYAVSVTTGPSTVTKRALAAEQMMAFVNAVPQAAAQVMDLVAEAQDWPKAPEFARRFRMSLPPGMVSEEDTPPEMLQQQQMAAQQQEAVMQLEAAKAEAEIARLQAQAQESMARAEQLRAQAYAAVANADARSADVEGKLAEKDFNARAKVVELAKGVTDDDGN
jgi:hypothetical protein